MSFFSSEYDYRKDWTICETEFIKFGALDYM